MTRRGVWMVVVSTFVLFGASSAKAQASAITGELIFVPGSTSFPASHASTVVELNSGDLLAAWFGGTAEGKPDVAIWSARKSQGQWSAPAERVRETGVPCWNPVLFHAHDGKLWLYYKFGPSPQQWTAGRMFSTDEGQTWSKPEHLPAGLLGPIRAKPLVLADGTIVSGTSVESYASWAVWIERSSDGGKKWEKIGPIMVDPMPASATSATIVRDKQGYPKPQGIIQPSVIALGGKHLRLYARSSLNIGHICMADSYDLGRTWTAAHPIDLPNPNSGIDAVALRDGRVVMIFNNTSTGRTPLNLAVSGDGEHFQVFATLESDPGEYSYPALIQDRKGDLDLTYTWNRKSIRHVHVLLGGVPHPAGRK